MPEDMQEGKVETHTARGIRYEILTFRVSDAGTRRNIGYRAFVMGGNVAAQTYDCTTTREAVTAAAVADIDRNSAGIY